jgi:hypothetical protein
MSSAYKPIEALLSPEFTPDELALNREGRLSKRQRQLLLGRSWGTPTTLAELLNILFIRKPRWWCIGLIRRVLGKEVNTVEGIVQIAENGYSLSIGDATFYLSPAVIKSFGDGACYRLYFEAHPTIYTPRLLSWEILEKE